MANLNLDPGVEANLEDILGKFNTQIKLIEGGRGKKLPRLSRSKLASLLLAVAICSNPDPDDWRMEKVKSVLYDGDFELDGEKNNALVKRLIAGLR